MISEKKLYETQAEWALNHTRYPDVIWAEDLFDITIVPYQGSIRKFPHYADMKDRLELYGLIVVMHTIQEVRILECRADVAGNRLYITEGIWRKFWKEIKKSIASAMAEHGLPVNPGTCLDLQFMSSPKVKQKKIQPVDIWTRRKQSLLDDPRNLFYYGGANGVIHDRDCPELKKIDPKDLQASATGPEELGYCPRCAYRLYARVACAPISKEVDAVEHLVRRHHIGIGRWIHYVEDEGLKLHVLSLTEYQASCNKDSWMIRVDEDGKMHLWHNNYIHTDDGGRYVTTGLHDQGIVSKNLTLMFDLICHYDWTYHLVPEEDAKIEDTEELSETTIAIQSKLRKLSNQNMAVRKRGMIECQAPDPEPLSGAFQANSLFGGIQGGLFAGLVSAASVEVGSKNSSTQEEDTQCTDPEERAEVSAATAEDDSEDLSEESEEKEEREVLPVFSDPWATHSGMLSVMGGFGNKSVFERLEALSKEEGEEDPE